MATVKLTDSLLRRIIAEEKAKLIKEGFGKMGDVEDSEADELDADEYGTDKALEQPIDHMKALKIREGAFMEALVKLAEAKSKAKKSKEADKKKADAKKAADKKKAEAAKKKPAAKKEAQHKKPAKKPAAKKSVKKESVRMNEEQLLSALRECRLKIALLKKGA